MLTGRFGSTTANLPQKYPSVGSYVSRVRGPNAPGMPAYVGLPAAQSIYLFPGYQGAAYLGAAYNPFDVDTEQKYLGHTYNVQIGRPKCLESLQSIEAVRANDRSSLLKGLDPSLRNQGVILALCAGWPESAELAGVFEAFTGTTVNLNAGSSITGTGEVRVAGGALNVNSALTLSTAQTLSVQSGTLSANAALSAGTLSMSGGTLTGTGTVTLTGTSSSWTGGSMSGSGATTIAGGATLNASSGGTLTASRPFTNQGTVNVSAGTLAVTNFTTNAGTIALSGGATFQKTGGFTNTGVIGGAGTFDVGEGSTLTN